MPRRYSLLTWRIVLPLHAPFSRGRRWRSRMRAEFFLSHFPCGEGRGEGERGGRLHVIVVYTAGLAATLGNSPSALKKNPSNPSTISPISVTGLHFGFCF